jgi:hypothetical protein
MELDRTGLLRHGRITGWAWERCPPDVSSEGARFKPCVTCPTACAGRSTCRAPGCSGSSGRRC